MSKSTLNQLLEEEDKIPLKNAIFAMIFITLVISLAVGGAFLFNENRQIRVISKYTKETRSLVQEKNKEFSELFDSTMELCRQELAEKKVNSKDQKYPPKDVICKSAQQKLADIGVDQLKDSSAIAYIKISEDNYELLEASGKYNEIRSIKGSYGHFSYGYRGNNTNNIYDFFVSNKPISMWDDYIRFIPFKEVIVPVVLDGDKIVGYIFRGVIEK